METNYVLFFEDKTFLYIYLWFHMCSLPLIAPKLFEKSQNNIECI